jgi:hypothetical protein
MNAVIRESIRCSHRGEVVEIVEEGDAGDSSKRLLERGFERQAKEERM